MEVVKVQDLHFDSLTTTPYMSAQGSPTRFVKDPFELYYHYTTAPTSPSSAAACRSSISFDWDDKPGPPKPNSITTGGDEVAADYDDDFAFDFSGHLKKSAPPPLTAADELFEKGKIRPLRPPPRLCSIVADSPRTPKSPTNRRGIGRNSDLFIEPEAKTARNRSRDRTPFTASSPSMSISRSRKGSRSLSPLRHEGGGGGGAQFQIPIPPMLPHPPPIASISCSCMGDGGGDGSRKWRLKDLLLFRSASEGRATGDRSKDPLQKYTALPSSSSPPLLSPKLNRKAIGGDDSRSSSFRSVDSSGSARRAVSPHARHYTAKRAAAEEMKKKTALPYRQSFFSCLRFNPALHSLGSFGDHSSNLGRP